MRSFRSSLGVGGEGGYLPTNQLLQHDLGYCRQAQKRHRSVSQGRRSRCGEIFVTHCK